MQKSTKIANTSADLRSFSNVKFDISNLIEVNFSVSVTGYSVFLSLSSVLKLPWPSAWAGLSSRVKNHTPK